MSKYNTPKDVIDEFAALKRRIEHLERFSKASTLASTGPRLATDFSTPVNVTSGSFVTTHVFACIYLAPTPVVRILATCSDGTTAGEFQIVDSSGVVLSDPTGSVVPATAIPTGTTTETPFENNQVPNYWNDFAIGTDMLYQLQVRRTAGSGTIAVRAKYLVQMPS